MNVLPVFHELGHALVAFLFGWHIEGLIINSNYWAVKLSCSHIPSPFEVRVIALSGGIAQALIGFGVLVYTWKRPEVFLPREKIIIMVFTIWAIIYGVFEAIFLPHPTI